MASNSDSNEQRSIRRLQSRHRGRHIALFAAAALLCFGAFSYLRSDLVAPYVVTAKQCGAVDPHIQYLVTAGEDRWLRANLPVNEGGEPLVEKYMTEVATKVIEGLEREYNRKQNTVPLRINILFVENDNRLSPSKGYDWFGYRTEFESPWVRILTNDWRPCSKQVIFYRNGRQIARDQMEMAVGRRIAWASSSELSQDELDKFSSQYELEIMSRHSRLPRDMAIEKLRKELPPDVMYAFEKSPHTDLFAAGRGFGTLMHDSIGGYANITNQALEIYLDSKRKISKIDSVIDLEHRDSGYLVK